MNVNKSKAKQTGLRQRQADGINAHTTSEFDKMRAERLAQKEKEREEKRAEQAAKKKADEEERANMEANIQAGISAGFKDNKDHTTNEANRVIGAVMNGFQSTHKKLEEEVDMVKKDKSKLQTTVRKQNAQLQDNDCVFKAIGQTCDGYTDAKANGIPSDGFKNVDDFVPEDPTSLEAVLAAFNDLKTNYAIVKDLFEEADDSLEIIAAAIEQAHLNEAKSPVKDEQAKKFISNFKGLKGIKKNIF